MPRRKIDEIYFNSPCYIVDGEVGQEFAASREAIRK
jgi:hypothetical protein